MYCYFFFFKQKTAYEMRISDWSSDVCSSDLLARSTFRHVIRSYLERGIQWYGSAQALTRLVELNSAIELRDIYEKPTIFLGRSEESRLGKEFVSTCRSRWTQYHLKNKTHYNKHKQTNT